MRDLASLLAHYAVLRGVDRLPDWDCGSSPGRWSAAGVQFGQQGVVALGFLSLATWLSGIVQVAEDDRLGRASLLAGGDDLAVADRSRRSFLASIFAAWIRCTQ